MKKIIILIAIFICAFTSNIVKAQNNSSIQYSQKIKQGNHNKQNNNKTLLKRLKFGGKLGFNLATTPTFVKINTSFNETRNVKSNGVKFLPSYYAGIISEYTLKNNNYKIQTEILYVRNGARHATSNSIKIDELVIPLILKYDVFNKSDRTLNVYGGVYTGYIFKVIGVYNYETTFKYNITNQYESFDSGMILGIEYPILDKLYIDARFNYGYMNIAKSNSVIENFEAEVKSFNRFFQIGVYYIL